MDMKTKFNYKMLQKMIPEISLIKSNRRELPQSAIS